MPFDLDTLLRELTSGDEERAQRAIQSMAERPFDSIESLTQLVRSADEDVRWWAVAALSHLPLDLSGEYLLAALDDPATSVRQCALVGLQRQPSLDALPKLIELVGSPNALTARLAGGALARLGEPAVPALGDVMQGDIARARIHAARALAEMRVESTIPILFEALEDPLSLVVYWAEEGLDRLGVGMTFFKP
jgi:HEAT repeat protein